MSARAALVEALRGWLPADVDVLPYARQIDPPDRSTVMVRVDELTPAPVQGQRDAHVALVLLVPGGVVDSDATAKAVEDELEALLADVLHVLDTDAATSRMWWTSAKRSVYGEPEPTNPAYEVTVLARLNTEEKTA